MTGETQTPTREQQLMEEFKAGLDKDGPIVLAQRVAALETSVQDLTQERNDLQTALDATEADRAAALKRADAAEKAGKAAAAKVTRAAAPAKPRKIGALADGRAVEGEDLQKAIADADEVEIAFTDGTREIAGLDPIAVEGDCWRKGPRGLVLDKPVAIEGPAGVTSVSIAGYALILDGKQVAYCERGMPLQLAARQRVTLENDIIF